MIRICIPALVLLVLSAILYSCTDELDTCLSDCGEPDRAGSDSPCGIDGWLYPSQCRMGCYGVEEAPDPLYCSSPATENECDKEHIDMAVRVYDKCGSNQLRWCYEPPDGWMINLVGTCVSGADNDCIKACPTCPEDDADFVCGKKGVRYCSECVMACLEDELADDPETCKAEAVFADFCDASVDTYATRISNQSEFTDYGCNVCNCENDIWHCTFWACPGEYEEM